MEVTAEPTSREGLGRRVLGQEMTENGLHRSFGGTDTRDELEPTPVLPINLPGRWKH